MLKEMELDSNHNLWTINFFNLLALEQIKKIFISFATQQLQCCRIIMCHKCSYKLRLPQLTAGSKQFNNTNIHLFLQKYFQHHQNAK